MQHETATVKKVVKKYKTVNGDEKESISFTAKFDNKSGFKDGDEVALLSIADINAIGDVDADEIQQLKNAVADKDKTIAANNESIAKFKADIKEKSDKIASLSKQNKASDKTITDLKSDVSAKDKKIAEMKSELKVANATIESNGESLSGKDAEINDLKTAAADSDKTIAELSATNKALHERLNELTDLLTAKDKTIDELDDAITDFKIQIAEFNAVDVDELKRKSKESDNVKDDLIAAAERLENKSNVISLLQNQIMELQQLVNYKDLVNDRLKNKGALDCIFNRDVTADISPPTLQLIDSSGNLIKEKDDEININATADDNDDAAADSDDSGKDTLTII